MSKKPDPVIKSSPSTIHTSRTLMFEELAKVMDFGIQDDSYQDSLDQNITNKATKKNLEKTNRYLRRLYSFDPHSPAFISFKYFWKIVDGEERPLLALLYALCNDFLLSESIPVVQGTAIGDKVRVEYFEENLEKGHPNRYSSITRKSVAKNLASSWKQAGYITGKVKSIRTKTSPSFLVVAFALLLSYLHGDRGDYILSSKWAQALDLNETTLRTQAFEAAKRDLLQYQFAGEVTTLSFHNLLNKLGIHVDS